MFFLQGIIESLSTADKDIKIPIPVDCEVEEAYALCDGAVSDGNTNKLVLQVFRGSTKLFELDSDAEGGFGDEDALQLGAEDGDKRFEKLTELQLKCDVTGTISVSSVKFVLKCKRARDI